MKPSNGKTVWEHPEKKFKPRNLQAARVMFPAHGINLPPEPVKAPTYAEPFSVTLARERKERSDRMAKLAEGCQRWPLTQKRQKPFGVKHRPKRHKLCKNFAAKQMKKLEKLTEACKP